MQSRMLWKRLLSGFLAMLMVFTLIPTSVIADTDPSGTPVTKDVTPLLADMQLVGVSVGPDGNYYVDANQSYAISLTIRETGSLEMDMTDSISFYLPAGVVAMSENNLIDIGVLDGYYKSIFHSYTISGNVMTITWNKNSEFFEDLARAHYVEFNFQIQATFDGTQEEIRFGGGVNTVIKVDNTGSVTVNKNVSGLRSDVTMTDAQKRAMTFELRNAAGEVVRAFTYADMSQGSITFDDMAPGTYTVVETGRPDFPNYTFDVAGSTTTASGTLTNGGMLAIGLNNDYDYHTGTLVLNKTVDCTNWDGTTSVPDHVKEGITFRITGPSGYDQTVSYTDFVDGKLTLQGLDVGEYTITETNSVTGYTWTYTVNNTAAESPSATAQITNGGTATVDFANTYVQQTANLTVQKTASGAAVPADTQFKITFPDGSQRTIRYSDMTDGKYTFQDVPLGTYKVEEIQDTASVDNYTLTVTGGGRVTLSRDGETKTSTIHNNYEPYGALRVSKSVAGNINAANITEAQRQAITFGVYDADGTCVATMTYADIVSGNGTLTELPVGQYTVRETAANIPGYTVVTTPAGGEVTVDVTVGQTATASFKNTYTKDEYTLTVNKAFGDGSAYTSANLPEAFRTGTVFTVQYNGTTVASCTYEELNDTLRELALSGPGPYVITETNPTVGGVGIDTEVSGDGGATYTSGTSITLTLENHEPAAVTFRNTYTLQGVIQGDKTVVGLTSYDEADIRDDLRFTVYRKVGDRFETYQTDVTLAQLKAGLVVPVGAYYVRETGTLGVDGYVGPIVTTQVGDGAIREQNRTDDFTVTQNGTVDVHFTNTYEESEDRADLQMVKYVSGLQEIDGNGEILLTGSLTTRNADGDLLYDAIRFKLEEKRGDNWYEYDTYTLAELLSGSISLRAGEYRLTELNAEVPGYSLQVDYLIESAGSTGKEGTGTKVTFKVEENQILKVQLHNNYTPLGNLKITKEIEGDIVMTDAERQAVVFEVTGPNNFSKTFTLADIYNARTGTYQKTYKNIPVGVYTVREIAGNTTEYTVTVSSNLTDDTVTVTFGGTAQAKFTNTYTRKTGSLTVEKNMAGEVPAPLTQDQMEAMTFTVKDPSGVVVASATYDDFTDGAYTFENLPTGTYTVTEQIGRAITNTYRVDIDGNNASVAVTENGNTEVALTNTFYKTGSLRLVKDFDGCDVPDSVKNTVQFQYWQVDADGSIIGSKHTVNYSDFTDGAYLIRNLLPGTYVVEELDNTSGYRRNTTVAVNDAQAADGTSGQVQIAFGETEEVTFTNTYEEVSSLVITKTIGGVLRNNMTDAQKAAIQFTVCDSEDNVIDTFTYAEMSGGTKTIDELEPGVYTVTEEITDAEAFNGYSCKTTYKIGSKVTEGMEAEITAVHGTNNVTFTNTYAEIQPLHVEKYSSDAYVGMVEKDGMMYPVWQFELVISNLNPLTTQDGTTEMIDTFDDAHAGWFRMATDAELQALDIDRNAVLTSLVSGKPAPAVAYNEAENKITISGITDDTADQCRFTYYLIVKDRDALREMNTPGNTQATGISHQFQNTVTYHPMPYLDDVAVVDAEYEYRFTALDKDIINMDSDGNLYEIVNGQQVRVNYADYSVKLNPDGVSIGDQPTIIAVDEFSENQTVLLSSIRTTPSENVSYTLDNSAHKIVFTIPNATPVTISYRAIIRESDDAEVTLKNDITLLGFVDSVEQEVTRSMGGEGQGKIYSINMVKVDELDNSLALEGVSFSLYDGETDERLITKQTDANGQIEFKYWGMTGSFKVGHLYYLVEESTISGYNTSSEKVWLKISDDEVPGFVDGVNILSNGGELIVTNAPVVANLAVTKDFNDWSQQGAFTFELKPVDDAPMPEGTNTVVTTQSAPTGTFGVIRYDVSDEDFADGASLTYEYTIQEIVKPDEMVDGVHYDTTVYPVRVVITDADQDGVREVDVTYGEGQRSLTVTNSYETVDVSGSKVWEDANNQDGKRPAAITVRLLADGTEVDVKTVTEEDGWSWSFTDLPKYRNGEEVTYTVTEDPVPGYTTDYDGSDIINRYTPETVDISGTKTWDDAGDQDGMRPDSITVRLRANGTEVDSMVVTEEDGWSWRFTGLPKYSAGTEIVYTVTEDKVDGYVADYDGTTITNSHKPETVDLSGSKTWDDANNQDGKRPASITIRLLANGEEVDTVTVTEEDNWSWSFTDLPKYEAGVEIVYTVTEDEVAEYTAVYDGMDVTNVHKPETVDLSGSKTWLDADNQDGMRPESITIRLLADGIEVDSTVVTEEDNWSWSFTGLPKYEAGVEIVYTVTEDKVDEYTTVYDGMNVTNSHKPETVDLSGSKTWDDANNQDGKRPESITIHLLADGEEVDTVTVTEADNWSWSFTDLPKYEAGVEIVYTVSEDEVAEYTAVYDGMDVTNSHKPETVDLSGSKTWDDADNQDGMRPESITIRLLADGEEVDTVTVTEADNWSWSFTDLPKYEAGVEIVYTVSEDKVDEYTTAYDGMDVTNTHVPETVDLSGAKTWDDADNQDGMRPESITIHLLANGTVIDTITVTEEDGWSWSFTGLPKYEAGKQILYTVSENPVAAYDASSDGMDVTNVHIPETVDLSGSKTWDDADNQDGMRPESITIHLLADGTVIDTITVTEADDWSWSFTDLPKYEAGVEIVYTVSEDAVDEYTTVCDGMDVTNVHIPETVEVSGSKTWDDADNQDGMRPESITIHLLADGEEIDTVTVTEEDNWSWSFTDLPKYEAGVEIVYTVSEDKVDEYTTVCDGMNVTNTHVPETVDISGTKTWDDADDQDGMRPESITIHLLANGIEVDSTVVTEEDGWSWMFTELPKYEAGVEIVYTVTEDTVDGYTTAYNGYMVINTHIPSKVSISVNKVWVDENNYDQIRPMEISVVLLANGEATDQVLVLSAKNNWSGTFADLDEYRAGEKIVYTVAERNVPAGYTSVISGTAEDGFVITNTHPVVYNNPHTGDDSGIYLWMMLMLVSGGALVALLASRKRRAK